MTSLHPARRAACIEGLVRQCVVADLTRSHRGSVSAPAVLALADSPVLYTPAQPGSDRASEASVRDALLDYFGAYLAFRACQDRIRQMTGFPQITPKRPSEAIVADLVEGQSLIPLREAAYLVWLPEFLRRGGDRSDRVYKWQARGLETWTQSNARRFTTVGAVRRWLDVPPVLWADVLRSWPLIGSREVSRLSWWPWGRSPISLARYMQRNARKGLILGRWGTFYYTTEAELLRHCGLGDVATARERERGNL